MYPLAHIRHRPSPSLRTWEFKKDVNGQLVTWIRGEPEPKSEVIGSKLYLRKKKNKHAGGAGSPRSVNNESESPQTPGIATSGAASESGNTSVQPQHGDLDEASTAALWDRLYNAHTQAFDSMCEAVEEHHRSPVGSPKSPGPRRLPNGFLRRLRLPPLICVFM